MIIAVLSLLAAIAGGTVSGVVQDSSGAVVPGASITARTAEGDRSAVSGTDGRFSVETAGTGSVTLIVRAQGFAEKTQKAEAAGGSTITVVLEPAVLREDITVTAARTEQRLGDVSASVNVLRSDDIRQSPAVSVDDVLRQIPTFSLFTRSSSISSNPTSQGVSLRGIGPSGVSRTLVLLDGMPFNEPFGGWVYWTRVPLEATERIEVVDGPSANVYGNYALGGAISINTAQPSHQLFDARTQMGNKNSPKFDFFGGDVFGRVGLLVDGSFFRTDGFPIVIDNERGLVDDKSNDAFKNVNVKATFTATRNVNGFVRTGYFHEDRDNGKHSTFDGTEEGNNTTWKYVSGGVRVVLPDSSGLQANVFGNFEDYFSNFLAVPAPPAGQPARSIGRMSLNQTVPTTDTGGMVQWSRSFSRNLIQAGTDWHWVQGESQEDGLNATNGLTVNLKRVSGGTQRNVGAYIQDMIAPVDNLEVTLSARVDSWSNYNAHNTEVNYPANTPTVNNAPTLPDQNDTVVTPRAAAIYHANNVVSVWGDIGSGFRAPTLNELYRRFSKGTVLTLPNFALGPERLVGGELGVNLAPVKNVTARITWFDNRVHNPVSNVTIATSGANVTVQRQNLGETEIQGLQFDAEYRINKNWRVSGGYLYDHATIVDNPSNPAIVGKFLQEVPENRGTFRVTYSDPRVASITFGVLAIGLQYDTGDDTNTRAVPGYSYPGLPAYATTELTISRALGRNVDVFFAAQNLFDQQYIVATLPTTIGSPRLVNGGIRVKLSGR
jgi:outer membrane receptor protein involved in Fe transport